MQYIEPIKGRITSKFGNRDHPISGKASFHNGVDIAAPVGTPVLAPADGHISEAWEHDRGGICLAMVDKSGVRFGFAHLQKRFVSVGDQVKAGQDIALSGNTGKSTGPHLHFTVKAHGWWVDPLKYFKFR